MVLETQCAIAGGGPAGMMLAVLLARAGISVVVLEKHRDFLRDFRGDTVHPSTLELMYELGVLDEFLQRPHQEVRELGGQFGDTFVPIADFSHLPTHCRFIALMPQWDFLDFLAVQGHRYPAFELMMEAEVENLLMDRSRVAGVRARTPRGNVEVRADLTIGADGRASVVREQAGLEVQEYGVPIDALWFRLSRLTGDPERTLGYLRNGRVFVTLQRGDYWQCAFVISKGGYDQLRREGLPAFRAAIASVVPFFRDRVEEIVDWDQVKLLTVKVNRLRQWHRDGLLCIGDAAHAMSPVGGVGINLAVQDAVAAANILLRPLQAGRPSETALHAVQRRREWPTHATQRMQLLMQERVIARTLRGDATLFETLPLPARLLRDYPLLRRIPARLVGLGFRPEHVQTPEVTTPLMPPTAPA